MSGMTYFRASIRCILVCNGCHGFLFPVEAVSINEEAISINFFFKTQLKFLKTFLLKVYNRFAPTNHAYS